MWGLVAAGMQGALVMSSWLGWERAARCVGPVVRHRLACLHFAALALSPVLTVAVLHWTVSGMGVAPPQASPIEELPRQMAGYRALLAFALPLAGLWILGVAVMSLRLAWDALYLTRLHRHPAPASLLQIVRTLAIERMGVAVPQVRMADVASPLVAGAWRPLLVVPTGLMHLPRAEHEALLLHELAHVQRHDCRWNLLQRIVLAGFWFHPAAWMLYRRLMREREMRCDALAVRHGASPLKLARGLVRLAEHRAPSALAMAAAGGGDFVARIHRLLGVDAAPTTSTAGARLAALTLSTLCLLALAAGRLGRVDTAMADLYHASSFGPTVWVRAHDPAGRFALRIKRGQVLAATVEELPLSRDRIRQQGSRVTLLDAARQPILALTVTPQDHIEWDARP
ncbi:M56 family metallopeptidase [Dyella sp. KRB-257]|uniref:M56 family metallopeptidase n=1 Tax=Dyella sp. KRB-257 TaxID=3400915 RepID=UPI003C0BB511